MKTEYLGRDTMQVLDELIINLVGLRTQCIFLPDEIIQQILSRAKNDITIITEGFDVGNE